MSRSRPLSTDPCVREMERRRLLAMLADAHRLMDAAGYPRIVHHDDDRRTPIAIEIGAPRP